MFTPFFFKCENKFTPRSRLTRIACQWGIPSLHSKQKMEESYMNNDELMIALWKIKGVKKVLDSLQTSELYEDSSDLFFILSNELQESLSLLHTES